MEANKEAMEYLVGLKQARTFEIDGDTYTDGKLTLVEKKIYRPKPIEVTSLGSLISLIKREVARFIAPTFVRVMSAQEIEVFSTYGPERHERDQYYTVKCDAPYFAPGKYSHRDAVIKLLTMFVENAGSKYVLDTIKRISHNTLVETEDNGVTQKVTMTAGVQMKSSAAITPIVPLKPYRTFPDVAQPESDFLFRVGERGEAIELTEADGGRWVLEAKRNVADYLEAHLKDLAESGEIVVMC